MNSEKKVFGSYENNKQSIINHSLPHKIVVVIKMCEIGWGPQITILL